MDCCHVDYIDPGFKKKKPQRKSLSEFSKEFKGYALIFSQEKKLAKANLVDDSKAKNLKGSICWCCAPSGLGGPGGNGNVEFDGNRACAVGMPAWMVNTVNLNFIVEDLDFRYKAKGMTVEFRRTYNSDEPKDGVFGRSWTFNYNVSLVENPDKSIDISRGDGKIDHFIWNGTRYQGPAGVYDKLFKKENGAYLLGVKKNKLSYEFTAQGVLTAIKDKNDNCVSFEYDAKGKLVSIIDPNEETINLVYGSNKKVSQVVLPDSRSIEFVYDGKGNLVESIDMKKAASVFEYDNASYMTSITTPHQGKTLIEYKVSSEGYAVESITDALGNTRKYDSDHSKVIITNNRGNEKLYENSYEGYTKEISMPSGNKVVFGYDDFGNRTSIKDAEGNQTKMEYDGRGNLTEIKDALNNTTKFEYDDNDNVVLVTDAKNNLTEFSYDLKDNLKSIKDSQAAVTSFEYNLYGQSTKIVDVNNGIREFKYDLEGNLTEEITPLGKVNKYGYDRLGRLTEFVNPKGEKFLYSYDQVDHLTEIVYPDDKTVSYKYNCCNLIEMSSEQGVLKFDYDAVGRVVRFTNSQSQIIGYEYDGEDNLVKLVYPDGKEVSYVYDQDERLRSVEDWLGNVTQYDYGLSGNIESVKSPGLLSIYQYSSVNQMVKLTNHNGNTMEMVSGFEYEPDQLGNSIKIRKYLSLKNPAFNLKSKVYTYNKENQLYTAGEDKFNYDSLGNLIRVTGEISKQFQYDYDNQVTKYQDSLGNKFEYRYDTLGNRIEKKESGKVTKYVVSSIPNGGLPSVLAETDASGKIKSYYVYGIGLISKIENNQAYYYQYDGAGSTVAISDKNGKIINKYSYSDFGQVATNSEEEIENPFKYVGKYGVTTDITDLLYMRARYYLPSIGRFISKDPLGIVAGLNEYNYVSANPIRFIDPLGLYTWPYTWQGWVGGLLSMAGTSLIFPAATAPVGWGLLIAGGAILMWDTLEGSNKAEDLAEKIAEKILNNDEWEEIDKAFRGCE